MKKMYLKGIKYAGMPVLQRNDRGAEVASLQKELIERNYLYDVADGSFGAKTEQAVIKLQSDAGLPQTGVVDEATRKALYNHTAKFVAQEGMGLVLYALEFDEDGHLYYYVKNMGSQTVTDWKYGAEQCDATKQAIGSFSGNRNQYWILNRASEQYLGPGETSYRIDNLKEGMTGEFSSGESYTITYFSDAKYAGAWLTSYTTGDGKERSASDAKLYAEIVR